MDSLFELGQVAESKKQGTSWSQAGKLAALLALLAGAGAPVLAQPYPASGGIAPLAPRRPLTDRERAAIVERLRREGKLGSLKVALPEVAVAGQIGKGKRIQVVLPRAAFYKKVGKPVSVNFPIVSFSRRVWNPIDIALPAMSFKKTGEPMGVSLPVMTLPGQSGKPVSVTSAAVSFPRSLLEPVAIQERVTLLQRLRGEGKMEPVKIVVPKALVVPVVGLLPAWEMAGIKAQASLALALDYASSGDGRAVAALDEYMEDVASLMEARKGRPRDAVLSSAQANNLVEVARFYQKLGEEKKAAHAYAQVSVQGFGWATGLALWEQANILIAQSKHKEARNLLLTSVAGQYADQTQVLTSSAMANSYYRTGEFEQAYKYSEETIKRYRSLKNPLRDEGLESQVGFVEELVRWIKKWQKNPIVCEPRAIVALVNQEGELEAKTTKVVVLRTYKAMKLEVTVADPQAQVRVVSMKPSQAFMYFFEQEVTIEVVMSALAKNLDTKLIVSSPEFKNAKVEVPVFVRRHKSIQ